jgi:hypothetical protein
LSNLLCRHGGHKKRRDFRQQASRQAQRQVQDQTATNANSASAAQIAKFRPAFLMSPVQKQARLSPGVVVEAC